MRRDDLDIDRADGAVSHAVRDAVDGEIIFGSDAVQFKEKEVSVRPINLHISNPSNLPR